jgi:WD40 repeat protein
VNEPTKDTHISTEGGAVVEGSVRVGGDFIGRDAYYGYTADQVRTLIAEVRCSDHPQTWDGRVPFKGLNAFREADAHFFFGREALVETLLQRVQRARFLCVSGPSGSGKSSLLRAGLFHALKLGRLEGSEGWLIADLTPQRDPMVQLAQAMARVARHPAAAEYLTAHGATEPLALHKQAEALLSSDPDQRMIVFVDQFEELFTQVHTREAREPFVTQIIQAATHPEGRVSVLIALRADFIAPSTAYPDLRKQMNRELHLVGALAPDELARAITLPVLEVGAAIEPELVAQVIADMKGEPGALPLMQFALRDLFAASADRPGDVVALTRRAYLARGGVDRALERHADAVLEALDDDQRRIARTIFTRVVEPGRGQADTRRLVTFDDLVSAGTGTQDVREVVQALADEDARLLTTGYRESDAAPSDGEVIRVPSPDTQSSVAETVTLAHERLIDAWPWLRRLIDENRALIATQNQIAEDARVWNAHGRDPSYLYSGARLANAEELTDAGQLELGAIAAAFVDAAIDRRKAAARRRRQVTIGLAALTVIAVLAAVFALFQSRRATARQLAADARLAAESGSFRVAVLLALEATRREPESKNNSELWKTVLFSDDDGWREIGALDPLSAVSDVAWSPDGTRLASASRDGIVHIWDTESAMLLSTLQGHTSLVSSVAWCPDGTRLASASYDGKVLIWNVKNGKALSTLEGHTDQVFDVAWSPDGLRLASASWDETVRIWNVEREESLITLEEHMNPVTSVSWSIEDSRLASASSDGTVYIWDTNNGRLVFVLEGHTDAVEDVVWSLDGSRLASASWDKTVRLWDANNGKLLTAFEKHTNLVHGVMWSPDDSRLASASADIVYLWDAKSGETLSKLEGHTDQVFSVAWSPDGTRLASASSDGTVRIWDAARSNALAILEGHSHQIESIAWSPDGLRIASAAVDGTVHIWDVVRGNTRTTLEGHTDWVESVAWSPDGSRLATASHDDTIRIWGIEPVDTLAILEGHTDRVTSVAWSPDASRLASASADDTVRIWDPALGEALTTLEGHMNSVYSVAWSPNGSHLASASWDRTVRIWDAVRGNTLVTFDDHKTMVFDVVWSSDGSRLASSSYDGKVLVWDVESKELLITIDGHTSWVSRVAWSPDNSRLASASGDETVRIWDAEIDKLLAILNGHTNTVSSVAWSPDGSRLASSSWDHTVHIRSERFLHPPCQWFLSNLTVQEWRQYFGELSPYRPTCPNISSPTLPSPWISMVEFLGDVGETDDVFLTYQGWGLFIGITLLVSGAISCAGWLVFRLMS